MPRHTNRLARETSPYLLQHQHNPVDWYAWGEEAFTRARAEGRPILLSIGYSACHWCHVMERESFENAETAALMNEHFVSIKVDREERPDIDGIYMQAGGAFLQPTLALLEQKGLLKPAGRKGHISIVSNDGIPQEFEAIRTTPCVHQQQSVRRLRTGDQDRLHAGIGRHAGFDVGRRELHRP